MKQNTASRRVARQLREEILSGSLKPGDRVPSARKLVRHYGIALATATKVLALLRRERLVRVEPGIGTMVRCPDGESGLSRHRIVQAAIAIADDDGIGALSMRGVAAELGVATMSLYRYVASKDEMLVLMQDCAMGEDSLPPKLSGGWRAQLEKLARLQWRGYSRHPWLAQTVSMTRPQLVPNGMKHTDRVLLVLDAMRFDPETQLRTGIAFMSYVRGLAMSVEPERLAERDTGMTNDEWMETQEAVFATLLPRFPTLARLSRLRNPEMSLEAVFECGLRCFLDGLAAQKR